MLAQVVDVHQRGVLKRLLIDAEVANAVRPKIRERGEGAPRAGTASASTDASE